MDKSNDSHQPGASSATGSALLRGVDQAGHSLHDTIDKVVDPARSSLERAAVAAHQTVDKLASGASSVVGKVGDQAQHLHDAPLQALNYSKTCIKDYPLQAVGAALLLGLLLGRLTARRY